MFKKLFTKTNILLLLILAVASYLRLYEIGAYLTFLGDEGRDMLVVYNILHGHLTLLGPTASVGGFFLGPAYYYFMTPFVWLFDYNPVGPAIMVALFGIATVWLTYFVGSKFFSVKVGLIGALLYAISPLIITYSKSSWNPNPMPFFVLALLYFLYKGIEKKDWKWTLLSGIFLGIAMQLHYLATFVGVIVGAYILCSVIYDFFVTKQTWIASVYVGFSNYLIYALGFVIGWSPFLVFEFRHGFNNIQSIVAFIFTSKETGGGDMYSEIVGNVFFRIFGRIVTAFPPPENVNIHTHPELSVWFYGTLILAIISLLFLAFLFIKQFKNRQAFLRYSLLGLWLGVGIFLFGFYKKNIYDYYFSFLFPAPILLTSIPLAWSLTQKWIVKIIGLVIIAVLVALNLLTEPILTPPNHQMEQVAGIAKKVYDEAGGKSFNFALITGGNSDHAYRYFLTIWGNPPVTILNPDVDPQRKSVTKQLLVVCEELPCHPEGASLWEVAGFGRAQIVGHWDVSVVQVYKLQHYYGK
ncbi:MAG TPA: glycosyltransferase family 39 protein [Patescibacteria group bacterium]|nr:glycosyltransferase family 39 protein [Patescibacteria group bacterium]